MIIELQNCDLEVHYIGTREEIQLQIAIEAIKKFVESYNTFGKTVSEATKEACNVYYSLMAAIYEALGRSFCEGAKNMREAAI